MARSQKQDERQRAKYRSTSGKYAAVNPCYCCGKSAGVEYTSHTMTDCTDAEGQNWGDAALCLCEKCWRETLEIATVREFKIHAQAKRGDK